MEGMPKVGEDVIVFDGDRAIGISTVSSIRLGMLNGWEGVWVRINSKREFTPFFVELDRDWETSTTSADQSKSIAPASKHPNAMAQLSLRALRNDLRKVYNVRG